MCASCWFIYTSHNYKMCDLFYGGKELRYILLHTVWMEKFQYIFGNIHIKILKLKAAMVDFCHTVAWEPVNSNNVLNSINLDGSV